MNSEYLYYKRIKSNLWDIRTFHAWPVTIEFQLNPGVSIKLSIGKLYITFGGGLG